MHSTAHCGIPHHHLLLFLLSSDIPLVVLLHCRAEFPSRRRGMCHFGSNLFCCFNGSQHALHLEHTCQHDEVQMVCDILVCGPQHCARGQDPAVLGDAAVVEETIETTHAIRAHAIRTHHWGLNIVAGTNCTAIFRCAPHIQLQVQVSIMCPWCCRMNQRQTVVYMQLRQCNTHRLSSIVHP